MALSYRVVTIYNDYTSKYFAAPGGLTPQETEIPLLGLELQG